MTAGTTRPLLADAALLSVGTLTRLPVPTPSQVTPHVAGTAMALAPVTALVPGAASALAVLVVTETAGSSGSAALLAAVTAIAAAAWVTGGLHLDGLADVADGLGSGADAARALDIMKRSDVGALGAATLMLVLLTQVVALAASVEAGQGVAAAVIAALTARTAMTAACVRGVPAARDTGLGAAVAGTIGPAVGVGVVGVVMAVSAALVGGSPLQGAVTAGVGVGVGLAVLHRCVRRFGGITGDVLGAVGEAAATGALVVLALI